MGLNRCLNLILRGLGRDFYLTFHLTIDLDGQLNRLLDQVLGAKCGPQGEAGQTSAAESRVNLLRQVRRKRSEKSSELKY